MKLTKYLPVALAMGVALASCQDDTENFDNKIFAPSLDTVTTIYVKQMVTTDAVGYVKSDMAKESDTEISVVFNADPSKVTDYNLLNSMEAEMLPEKFYTIPEPVAVIPVGGNTTGNVAVNFHNLTELDLDKVYVLPVTMSSPAMEATSNATYYFVLREAALISTTPDMTKNYAVYVQGNQATELGSLSQITVEALLYPYDFPNMLATVMGIEGGFLVRIGDAGIPANRLQLATPNGNLTDAAWEFDTNTWTFMTLTYDCATGECNVYFNGVKKGATQTGSYPGPINWNTAAGDITDGPRGFYVGYAYDANRYFNGQMSELRVWNRCLTQEEINAPLHFYTVPADSEGLVAYWKLDEGGGKRFKDYANGYDLICPNDPTWVQVSIPEK